MNLINKKGEKITPDFVEEDFISAVETNFNRSKYYSSKNIQIRRISQCDENELGYDGVLTTIVPFYIQFKRSYFYTPFFKGKLSADRKSKCLPIDKGFYALELLRKNKKYEQHNAMFKLSQTANAAYVAPLFYKSNVLDQIKSSNSDRLPNFFNNVAFFDFIEGKSYRFNSVRTLKNAVSITPHRKIIDKEPSHHYSYSKDLKIGFHSESELVDSNKVTTLYKFVSQLIETNKLNNQEEYVDKIFRTIETLFKAQENSNEFGEVVNLSIRRLSSNSELIDFSDTKDRLSILDKLSISEDILKQYFGIQQFLKYEIER